MTSGRSWRGSGASGGRETGRNEPQAGSCDRLDWDVRGRQDERGGFQVVWDRSLNFLSPRSNQSASPTAVGGRRSLWCAALGVRLNGVSSLMMLRARSRLSRRRDLKPP